jgi:segregation and condensation protein B
MERETSIDTPAHAGGPDSAISDAPVDVGSTDQSPDAGPDAAPAPAPHPGQPTVVAGPEKRKRRPDKRADQPAQPEPELDPALIANLEALIISLDRPVQPVRLAQGLGLLPMPDEDSDAPPLEGPIARAAVRQVERAIAALNDQYAASNRAFRVESVAGGFRVMTLPAFAPILAAFHKRQTSSKLSRAAVETLAIIAYKQPLTKAELEAIRGVSCGEVLKTLLEKRLVTVKGRAEELGRPLLYGTTTDFLKLFGLASIKDLPSPTELKLNA